MSFQRSVFIALIVIGLAGGTTIKIVAESIAGADVETRNWRALFHNGNYNRPCPLTVYSEDMSKPVPLRGPARSPLPKSAVQHATGAASRVSHN
jgi:hypothetical protein